MISFIENSLNYIEYAKLPDFNFLNVAEAFTEDQPIQLDQIIEIVPVPGKSLDSVRLTLDLPSGFSIIGPTGMVSSHKIRSLDPVWILRKRRLFSNGGFQNLRVP